MDDAEAAAAPATRTNEGEILLVFNTHWDEGWCRCRHLVNKNNNVLLLFSFSCCWFFFHATIVFNQLIVWILKKPLTEKKNVCCCTFLKKKKELWVCKRFTVWKKKLVWKKNNNRMTRGIGRWRRESDRTGATTSGDWLESRAPVPDGAGASLAVPYHTIKKSKYKVPLYRMRHKLESNPPCP